MSSSSPDFKLVPLDLSNQDDFLELQRQRKVCGWDYITEKIQYWQEKQNEGVKSPFWIVIADSASPALVRIGHVSLDSFCDPPDQDLARADRTVMTIQSFFILPEFQEKRLGRKVVQLLERMAKEEPYGSPKCKFIAINTLHKRYHYENGPDALGIWELLDGHKKPKFCMEEWYERLGYVRFKEAPRYPEVLRDGSSVMITSAFLRKPLL